MLPNARYSSLTTTILSHGTAKYPVYIYHLLARGPCRCGANLLHIFFALKQSHSTKTFTSALLALVEHTNDTVALRSTTHPPTGRSSVS